MIGALLAHEINCDSDSEEEIEVRKFIYNDILYLIDDNNNIYDYHSHDCIGKWNNESKIIETESSLQEDEDSDDDKSELYYDRSRFTEEKLTQYDQNMFRNNKYGREIYVGKIFDIRKNGMISAELRPELCRYHVVS